MPPFAEENAVTKGEISRGEEQGLLRGDEERKVPDLWVRG